MPENQPFKAGTNWMPERSKLYRFTDVDVTVIRPWPDPRAWYRATGRAWMPAMPLIHLEVPGGRANRAAWATVPSDVKDGVLRAHFAGLQWSTLSMLGRCPGSLDLVNSIPFLAAMLAVGNRFRSKPVTRPWRSVRALMRQPDGWKRWRQIGRWLGVDDSRAYIRMLRKIHFDPLREGWTWRDADIINRVWATPNGRTMLQHARVLRRELFIILNVLAEVDGFEHAVSRLHPHLVDELGETHGYSAPMMVEEIVGAMHLMHPNQPVQRLRSLEHIESLRARLRIEFQQHRPLLSGAAGLPVRVFPPPPFEGTAEIVPIESCEALAAEGRTMSHCIGNGVWTTLARMRLGYGYHVSVNGEEATVWLMQKRGSSFEFTVDQIQGSGNTRPSEGLQRTVRTWVRNHSNWAAHRHQGRARPEGPELPDIPDEWHERPKGVASNALLSAMGDDIPF